MPVKKVSEKCNSLLEVYKKNGFSGSIDAIYKSLVRPIYQPPSIYLHSRLSRRYNFLNSDWDLLIILDTCRPDAIKSVKEEYDFITNVETRWSVGANSAEWILNTFNKDFYQEISETAYITSNPHSVTVLEEQLSRHYDGDLRPMDNRLSRFSINTPVKTEDFHTYISLHQYRQDNSETSYTSPRMVTDHAIDLDRRQNPPRIVVHYMPPHTPYVAERMDDGEIKVGRKREETWGAYLDNLRWALNEVEILLKNVDRDRVVISADHGENFKYRRFRARHGPGMISPSVRRVPWITIEANDTGSRQPDIQHENDTNEVEETLEALGYI